jgi:hypothetical protein
VRKEPDSCAPFTGFLIRHSHGGTLAADQPISLSSPLRRPSPTLPAPYPLAHTSDTTSTSLASRVPDGSKRFVKSLTDIFVISLRLQTGSQRGHKQLLLTPHLIIFTTSIELIPILTRMLDIQCALRTIDKICLPPSSLSRNSRRVRSWGLVSISSVTQANASYQMPAFRRHIDLDSGHPLLSSDLSE